MKITRYGITLHRINEATAETVRQWRNEPKIAQHMFHQGEITPAMQKAWLQSVSNNQNFFFLIEHNEQYVGLINISSIDWENRTAFSGLFIYDDNFLGTDIPVMSSLCMLDVFLLLFDIQIVYAKVRGNNKVAHRYNTALGFTRTKQIELGQGYEYALQKEVYLLATRQLRNAAIHLKGNTTLIHFDEEENNVLRQKLLALPAEKKQYLMVQLT